MFDKIVKIMAIFGSLCMIATLIGAANIDVQGMMTTISENLTITKDLTVKGKINGLKVDGDVNVSNNIISDAILVNSTDFVIHNTDNSYNWNAYPPRGTIMIMLKNMITPPGWADCDGTQHTLTTYDPVSQGETGSVTFTAPKLTGFTSGNEFKFIVKL